MGWTTFYKSPDVSAKDCLIKECLQWSSLPEDQRPFVVDHCQSGTTHYFALKLPATYPSLASSFSNYLRDSDGGITCALVFLTSSKRDGHYNFGYKDMDETAGPYENQACGRLLDKLTPLNPESKTFAHEWRARCRANLAKPKPAKLLPGAIVALPEPLKFSDGIQRQRFQVVMHQGWNRKRAVTRFKCQTTGALCSLASYQKASLQVVA